MTKHASRATPAAPVEVGGPHPAVTPDAEDRQLVTSVVAGDRKATAEFVERFTDGIYGYVRHRLSPRVDLVDDLVQDVFLAALKGLPSFAGRSSLKTWLAGIARHKVEDFYRAHLRRAETPSDFDDDSAFVPLDMPEFDEQMDRATLEAKTQRVLSQLPETYCYALVWRYWENRSVRDIAAETGRTEKAGERLLARARAQFRRLWEED